MGKQASAKRKGWFKMTEMYGVQQARWRHESRRWGLEKTIDLLTALNHEWTIADNLYGQIEEYGDFSPILIGDISVEGGPRNADKMKDHKSHLSGREIDIYIFRSTDHETQKQRSIDAKDYHYSLTLEMTKQLFRLGSDVIQMVFFDDLKLINEVRADGHVGGKFFGPDPGRPSIGGKPAMPPTPHRDHMHVRLKP